MRITIGLLLLLALLAGCSSGPESMIGETKQDALADVDVADITADRSMEFGEASLGMYANFGEFANDKVALGCKLTPALDDLSEALKARTQVGFTTVMERTPQARAGRESATATTWYFWV